jgi:3-hydroxyacyl-CoA dehydrogenase
VRRSVAIIGAGLIGRSWSLVFLRAGWHVRIFDPSSGIGEKAVSWVGEALGDFGVDENKFPAIVQNLTSCATLEEAVDGADYVQENASEVLEAKKALFEVLDSLTAEDVPIGSSTSGLVPSSFCANLPGRHRAMVAHPVNPPHLVPLVELVPSPFTDRALLTKVHAVMTEIGQRPITLEKEVPGFVLNRLQTALVNEAMSLAADGVAGVDDIDKCVRHGLGLRWAFIGPFETMDLNADGGIGEYSTKFRALFETLGSDIDVTRPWDDELRAKITEQRRAILPLGGISERQKWRDRQLIGLLKHKSKESCD